MSDSTNTNVEIDNTSTPEVELNSTTTTATVDSTNIDEASSITQVDSSDAQVNPESIDGELTESQQQQMITAANATEGGRELSKTVLYVGGIHKSVSEDTIKELFSSLNSPILSLKLLYDKNRPNYNYAFIEYDNNTSASSALDAFNGSTVLGNNSLLKINWAFQSQQLKANDAFNLFIGDLSSDITDDELLSHFNSYTSLIQAHVMWDMKTGRSRGYGFLSFGESKDAEDCLNTKNGDVISGRPIRLNWASHKLNNNNQNNMNNNQNNQNNRQRHHNNNNLNHPNQYMMNHAGLNVISPPNLNLNINNGFNLNNNLPPPHHLNSMPLSPINNSNLSQNGGLNLTNPGQNGNPMNGIPQQELQQQQQQQLQQQQQQQQHQSQDQSGNDQSQPRLSYEQVLRQAPNWQSTVYIGNLSHFTTQNQLLSILTNFGYIVDFKFQIEKGCAFIRFDSHERAAFAITNLIGFKLNGRVLKFGWGKDNRGMNQHQHHNQHMVPPPHQLNSFPRFPPMYNHNQNKFN